MIFNILRIVFLMLTFSVTALAEPTPVLTPIPTIPPATATTPTPAQTSSTAPSDGTQSVIYLKQVDDTINALMQENAMLQKRLDHLNTQMAFLKHAFQQSNIELQARLDAIAQAKATPPDILAPKSIDESSAQVLLFNAPPELPQVIPQPEDVIKQTLVPFGALTTTTPSAITLMSPELAVVEQPVVTTSTAEPDTELLPRAITEQPTTIIPPAPIAAPSLAVVEAPPQPELATVIPAVPAAPPASAIKQQQSAPVAKAKPTLQPATQPLAKNSPPSQPAAQPPVIKTAPTKPQPATPKDSSGGVILGLGITLAGLGFLLLLFALMKPRRPTPQPEWPEEPTQPTEEHEYQTPNYYDAPEPEPTLETSSFEPEPTYVPPSAEPSNFQPEFEPEPEYIPPAFVDQTTDEPTTDEPIDPIEPLEPREPMMQMDTEDQDEGEASYLIADEELDQEDLDVLEQEPTKTGEMPAPPEAPNYDFSEQIEDTAGIKLDLARAYLEMKDFTAAEEILHGVMKEGSKFQQKEAQQLLDELHTLRES